jgi:hypothetical protein
LAVAAWQATRAPQLKERTVAIAFSVCHLKFEPKVVVAAVLETETPRHIWAWVAAQAADPMVSTMQELQRHLVLTTPPMHPLKALLITGMAILEHSEQTEMLLLTGQVAVAVVLEPQEALRHLARQPLVEFRQARLQMAAPAVLV